MHQRLTDFIHWIGFSRILASAFGVVVMVVGVWWVVRVPPPPLEASIPFATTSVASNAIASNTGETSALPSAANIMVYVSGEVVKPGVYVLLATARVIDALQAAGGATNQADLVVVNLASPLVDAAQVFIPRMGSTPRVTLPRPHAGINLPIAGGSGGAGAGGGAVGNATSAAGIVDINSATLSDLDALPGVGPSTAQAIIDYRVANGPYASVDDLLNVRGIGPSKLAAMRARVRV
ncbi:MAG: helix-hairpin-helix domain-containing protein [Actinomycetota bacterium]